MPGLARKLIICAAVDGLVIQPLSYKGQRQIQPVKVKYGDCSVSPITGDQVPDTTKSDTSFEAFGIIGMITVSKLSYLITITRRAQVAQLFGYPIYVATEVSITPCSSKTDADQAVRRTAAHLRQRAPQTLSEEEESSDDEDVTMPSESPDEVGDATPENNGPPSSSRSSVAEDVIRKRGSYGRFASRWFSGGGWTQDQKRTMGMSNSPTSAASAPKTFSEATTPKTSSDLGTETPGRVSTLLPKLLTTAQVLFGRSRSFFFSYDLDITRNLASKSTFPIDAPLYAQVDSIFFWNRNLMQPFLESGQEGIVLPVMQGFVGQRSFVVDADPPQVDESGKGSLELSSLPPTSSLPSSPPAEKMRTSAELRMQNLRPSERAYDVTVISRRSTKRAGLRYHRRGVDEDGFTANMVETEQILTPSVWDNSSTARSFMQIRGSIPLFFSQSPYSLKPVPVLQHSKEKNYNAFKTHFERLSRAYGLLQIVNLVEKHGIEEPIGSAYQRNTDRLNEELGQNKSIPFEWFDFHQACRGMKFENVSTLLLTLKGKLEDLGSTTQIGGTISQKQKGVLRTNCMDCLDRTNVCQSSFAKHMLDVQLKEEGIDMSAQLDQETAWFNTLWADNGDAVSKQYASTAAMKGDYTRTRKRDYRGALNDLGLSITRFYNGMVNDFFSQACIDFLLGNVSSKVFDEFEADMMTKDPAVSMSKMREQAIELCQRRVIADDKEEFHGGWALISPSTSDSVKSWQMEEIVLLLTDAALYLCRFDWNLDKVSSFERVHLGNLTHIKFGTYITSTVSPSHMDELRNVGFVVTYQPGKSDFKRTNTRTLSSKGDTSLQPPASAEAAAARRPTSFASFFGSKPKGPARRMLAFKAPYTDSSMAADRASGQNEIQQVVTICAEIERLAFEVQPQKAGGGGDDHVTMIEKGEIISLEEAKRNTGLFEQLGHSIKKMVWA